MKAFFLKLSIVCAFLISMPFYLSAFGGAEVPDNGKKNVAVTFDAIAELTRAVAQDKVNISVIIPKGMEPHDFEPKAKDLAFLSKADVVVYNGLEMEFWFDDALNAVKNVNLLKIEAAKGIEPIKAAHHHHHHHDEDCDCGEDHGGHSGNHECKHGEFDPHVWLSPSSAKIMIKNIEQGLSQADPENALFYKENADNYILELDNLLKDYSIKFSKIKNRKFVTGHAAFAYLCRDFNLEQNAVTGVFSEGEANAKDIAKLVDFCKKNNIKVIFSEETASKEVAAALAREVNAKVEKIYTMELPENNLSYMERMKYNLNKIYENLH